MSTLSIPISAEQEEFIKRYIKEGKADNKAQVVRRALKKFAEDETVEAILRAEAEKPLTGDLRMLMKKLR